MQIRIYDLIEKSRANGPGIRFAIYFQGCQFKCLGCINPQTHDINAGLLTSTEAIIEAIYNRKDEIEGVTFTGGEPLLQLKPLFEICRTVKKWNLTVLLSTGFETEELEKQPNLFSILTQNFDVIISGRFHHKEYIGTGMVGSANKRIILNSTKYCANDIINPIKMEIEVTPHGIRVAGTGINGIIDWSTF